MCKQNHKVFSIRHKSNKTLCVSVFFCHLFFSTYDIYSSGCSDSNIINGYNISSKYQSLIFDLLQLGLYKVLSISGNDRNWLLRYSFLCARLDL